MEKNIEKKGIYGEENSNKWKRIDKTKEEKSE